jgi:hypothetical protein
MRSRRLRPAPKTPSSCTQNPFCIRRVPLPARRHRGRGPLVPRVALSYVPGLARPRSSPTRQQRTRPSGGDPPRSLAPHRPARQQPRRMRPRQVDGAAASNAWPQTGPHSAASACRGTNTCNSALQPARRQLIRQARAGERRPLGCRIDASTLQDGPHRARPDPVLVPQATQLTVDAARSPAGTGRVPVGEEHRAAAAAGDRAGKQPGGRVSQWIHSTAPPLEAVTQAARELFGNIPPGTPEPVAWPLRNAALYTLLWVVIIIAVFAPLAVTRYKNAAAK